MSKIIAFRRALLSKLFFTKTSRLFCFAIEDFFAIPYYLFFATRAFLALFAVRVSFIHHVDTSTTENDLVALRWIGFNRSSYFHDFYLLEGSNLYNKAHLRSSLEFYLALQICLSEEKEPIF